MNTSLVSARYKRSLGNGDLNPSVYTTGLLRIELSLGNFGNLPIIAHGYPHPMDICKYFEDILYKPIKQTFKKNLLQISQ